MTVFSLLHILYLYSSLYLTLLQASPAYSTVNCHISPGQTPKLLWILVSQYPPFNFYIFYFLRSWLLVFFSPHIWAGVFVPAKPVSKLHVSPGDQAQISSQDPQQILTHHSEPLVKTLFSSILYYWLGIQPYLHL